jgi:hypothetical protein
MIRLWLNCVCVGLCVSLCVHACLSMLCYFMSQTFRSLNSFTKLYKQAHFLNILDLVFLCHTFCFILTLEVKMEQGVSSLFLLQKITLPTSVLKEKYFPFF